MDTTNNHKRVDKAISQLKKSAADGTLVAVIGTGVSMALTNGKNSALSWNGLIKNGFEYGVTKGKITLQQRGAWESQLSSNDLDDLLGAAEFMGRKLNAPDGDLYGTELLHQTWLLYEPMRWPRESWLPNTFTQFLSVRPATLRVGRVG
jgi:hypothetical protein